MGGTTVSFDVFCMGSSGCADVITPWSQTQIVGPLPPGTYTVMATAHYGWPDKDGPAPTCTFTVGYAARVDRDQDADVDLEDFVAFQACFNGPNRPASMSGCDHADYDADGDVDLDDFTVFQSCFNGPNRPTACP